MSRRHIVIRKRLRFPKHPLPVALISYFGHNWTGHHTLDPIPRRYTCQTNTRNPKMAEAGPSNVSVLTQEKRIWLAKKRQKKAQVKEILFDEGDRRSVFPTLEINILM